MCNKNGIPHFELIEQWVQDVRNDNGAVWEYKEPTSNEWNSFQSDICPGWYQNVQYRRHPTKLELRVEKLKKQWAEDIQRMSNSWPQWQTRRIEGDRDTKWLPTKRDYWTPDWDLLLNGEYDYRRTPKSERPFFIVLCELDGNYVFSVKSSKWETKDAFIVRLNTLGYKIKSKLRKTFL